MCYWWILVHFDSIVNESTGCIISELLLASYIIFMLLKGDDLAAYLFEGPKFIFSYENHKVLDMISIIFILISIAFILDGQRSILYTTSHLIWKNEAIFFIYSSDNVNCILHSAKGIWLLTSQQCFSTIVCLLKYCDTLAYLRVHLFLEQEDDARVKRAFQTLLTYVGNVARNPDEEKFRKIRLSNQSFQVYGPIFLLSEQK